MSASTRAGQIRFEQMGYGRRLYFEGIGHADQLRNRQKSKKMAEKQVTVFKSEAYESTTPGMNNYQTKATTEPVEAKSS